MWEAQLDPGRSQLSGEIHVLCQVHRSWFMHNTARRYQSNDAPRCVPISPSYRGIAYSFFWNRHRGDLDTYEVSSLKKRVI
jgi:hypothetical protein